MAVLNGMNKPHNPHSIMTHRGKPQHMVTLERLPQAENNTGKGLPVTNELTREWSMSKLGRLQYTDTTPMGGANHS